ncbi:hypothetical protein AVEN_102338-1 [Araneus ventricosus]|uniref:Uncharacterized protein n=1 Tax=Araneus ventricosus TaxID=182803 RepID=A0A4Y2PR78_ARAVE|nr:hypothetical protein AVEN_102338-1 [Araneus ventricosus]
MVQFFQGLFRPHRWLKFDVLPDTRYSRYTREMVLRTYSHGAPGYKTSSRKQYLEEEFGEQVIGYGGFQDWSPRSPDLTPMDFFLWGYLKQQVYATPSPALQDLQ